MKTFFRLSTAALVMALGVSMCFSSGCKKKSGTEPATGCQCWNQNWLIGTWEGTTPSSVNPFAGTRVRIVFTAAHLKVHDSIAGNARKVWTYSGTLTWDADGATPRSMPFDTTSYPLASTIFWECVEFRAAGVTVNDLSLRIADPAEADLIHTIYLDWGPAHIQTNTALNTFGVYGSVQVEAGGVSNRADYPPEAGSMITLTKK